jgi:hypothetical protein
MATDAPTPATDLLAIANDWLAKLGKAGESADPAQFSSLFVPIGWMRGMPWPSTQFKMLMSL